MGIRSASRVGRSFGDHAGEAVASLFLRLPDWAGYALAVATFYGTLVLHDRIQKQNRLLEGVTTALGFLLVIFFVTVASMRVMVDSPRWKFLEVQRHMGDVLGLSGLYFEGLIAELFEARGYQVRRRGGEKRDGGIDLLIKHSTGQWAIVQCKQRRWGHVTVAEVRELSAVVARHQAPMGILVTSGLFSSDARDWASGEPLQLIDGPALWRMIEAKRGGAKAGEARERGEGSDHLA